jgi:hypothetical protein
VRCAVSRNSLILEIQAEALRPNVDVAGLLRKAKVAAIKLDQNDAAKWIDLELDGYNCKFDDLPDYRRAHGVLKLDNPYRGRIPVHFKSARTEEMMTRAPISAGVGAIQSMIAGADSTSDFLYQMSSQHRNAILESLEIKLPPLLLVTHGQMKIVLERVISLVLNWSLALEKAGVLGEGLSFSREEKEMAKPVTHNIIAQNIGHIGNITDSAKGQVELHSHGDMQLDQRKMENLLAQARDAVGLLPEHLRTEVSDKVQELEAATSDAERRSILQSTRAVLEGAGGNLAATGILGLIASIIG